MLLPHSGRKLYDLLASMRAIFARETFTMDFNVRGGDSARFEFDFKKMIGTMQCLCLLRCPTRSNCDLNALPNQPDYVGSYITAFLFFIEILTAADAKTPVMDTTSYDTSR